MNPVSLLRCTTLSLVVIVLTTFLSPMVSAADVKIGKGERIVFLGDSITAAGVRPKGYVTQVKNAIAANHSELKIEIIGAGISGHKVPDCQKRLKRDVLSKKPTIVVIYIGINDVWHSTSGRGTSKEDFESGLHDLIKRSKQAGARVILCTPSVIGEETNGANRFDKMLDEYSDISRKVAKDTGSQLLDLRHAFVDYLKKHNKQNKSKSVLTTDGVHLNNSGNEFVAHQMLIALGAAKQERGKMLRHVVLFKFKKEASEKQIQEIVDAFGALRKKIDVIQDYEWGTNVSPENKAEGFSHLFLVTFRDEKGRDAYLPHAAHQEFVAKLLPILDKVLVFDYWAK